MWEHGGSALPEQARLLHAPGPPELLHVSAEVAVPALGSHTGPAAAAAGSASARSGPRPPAARRHWGRQQRRGLTRVPGAISPFLAAPGGSAAIGGGGAGRRGAWNAQNAGVHGPPRALGPSLRRRPGRRRMELGGAGGEALPRAAARPFQGEVLLWGAQSLSPPRPTGAPRAQGAQLLARAPLSPGSESQLPSPHPAPPLLSAPGPLTGPFPAPTAQGSRARPGPPHRFRGSIPAHRRFPGRGGSL